jgi:hypothetical protein
MKSVAPTRAVLRTRKRENPDFAVTTASAAAAASAAQINVFMIFVAQPVL